MFVALSFAASKPVESVVFCFYKITVSKTENVSVFYEFTGTINCTFFNQSERAYYLIYFIKIHKLAQG